MELDRLKRRSFITLLGGAVTWPVSARAQQPEMPVIGFLNSETPGGWAPMATAFRRGLSEAGFAESRNVVIEYRWARGQNDRLPGLAAELVSRKVAVIVAAGTSSAVAAKAATTTTPIVFSSAADPVALGLIASLNRPGGNVTGVTNLGVELVQKQLEVLHEVVPTATVVAGLINPTFPGSEGQSKDLQMAARTLGLQLHVLQASTERDLDAVFATMVELRAGALVIGPDAFFLGHRDLIAELATRHAMPTIFYLREFAAAGGLMSYGVSVTDGYRLVGIYTGRILKGEQPSDLPVQGSTKFELVLNLKTAKALGLTVPPTLLARADEVIE
jgi:putative tryptophan/tyrosine transport system substrate-binding protein